LEFSIEQKRTLLHADKAERFARLCLRRVEALSIVMNLEDQLVA
jgi:hypothetical protein